MTSLTALPLFAHCLFRLRKQVWEACSDLDGRVRVLDAQLDCGVPLRFGVLLNQFGSLVAEAGAQELADPL